MSKDLTHETRQRWTLPDGFTVTVVTRPDPVATPYDADCYGPEQINAWCRDEWWYELVCVRVCDARGREWGESVLGAVEAGNLPGAGAYLGEAATVDPGQLADLVDDACTDAAEELRTVQGAEITRECAE